MSNYSSGASSSVVSSIASSIISSIERTNSSSVPEEDELSNYLIVAIIFFVYFGINVATASPLFILFCLRKSLVRRMSYKFPIVTCIVWTLWVALIFLLGVVYCVKDHMPHKAVLALILAADGLFTIITSVVPGFRATCHKFDAEELDRHLQGLRSTNVDLHFDIVASHTETTSSTDSDGNSTEETHTVVTYRGTRYVTVPYWVDLTKPLVIPPGAPYIRIESKPKIEWCHDSEKIVESIRNRLWKENRHRDKDVTVTTVTKIPGLIPHMILRSPLAESTKLHDIMVNPFIGFLFNLLGFSVHHALLLARNLPVVKNKVHKKVSFVRPVVDDSWLKQYKVTKFVMTPRGDVLNNIQQVDTWNMQSGTFDSMKPTQPIFDNPMPLYVPYDTAVQYETPSAPPLPYMCMDGQVPVSPDMQSAYPGDPNAVPMQPVYTAGNAGAPPMDQGYAAAPSAPPMDQGYGASPSAPPMDQGYAQDPSATTTTTTTTTTVPPQM